MKIDGKSPWTTENIPCRRCKRKFMALRHEDDKPQPEVCPSCYLDLIVDDVIDTLCEKESTDGTVPPADVQHGGIPMEVRKPNDGGTGRDIYG